MAIRRHLCQASRLLLLLGVRMWPVCLCAAVRVTAATVVAIAASSVIAAIAATLSWPLDLSPKGNEPPAALLQPQPLLLPRAPRPTADMVLEHSLLGRPEAMQPIPLGLGAAAW